jgi:hypothetical protein
MSSLEILNDHGLYHDWREIVHVFDIDLFGDDLETGPAPVGSFPVPALGRPANPDPLPFDRHLIDELLGRVPQGHRDDVDPSLGANRCEP